MTTSESFLLPHTFPSLPDDMMRLESSAGLLAEVGKKSNSSIDNAAEFLSLNEDRGEENHVHPADFVVLHQTTFSSCTATGVVVRPEVSYLRVVGSSPTQWTGSVLSR